MTQPFYTIGHSTRSIGEFANMLTRADVELVVDVRSVPRSRTNPQFNKDVLPEGLSDFHIGYEHMAALGGLRARRPDVLPNVNAFWQNQSFHNYADYAMSEIFREAVAKLRQLGHGRRCAVMCAEAVWWRCHRRIIADYLILAGEVVFNILGPKRTDQARMTDMARAESSEVLTYPATV